MSDFQDLLAVDEKQAFSFFVSNLQDEVQSLRVKEDEMLYVATVLAHFSQVPRFCAESLPVMADLTELFDTFVIRNPDLLDSEIFEHAGSQVILFAGFFRDQMRSRHNVSWYDRVGSSFYFRASQYTSDYKRKEFFEGISDSLPLWTKVCHSMSKNLRANRYIVSSGS